MRREALEEALDIYRDIGDRLGQANALTDLGSVRRVTGDYRGAAEALEKALDIYRDIGDRLGQANALSALGNVRQLTGDYRGAAAGARRGAGHLPRHRRPARSGQRPHLPGGRAAADRGLPRCGAGTGSRRWASTATSATGSVRPTPSTHLGNVRQDDRGLPRRGTGTRDRRWTSTATSATGRGQANALIYLGIVRRVTGDYRGAAADAGSRRWTSTATSPTDTARLRFLTRPGRCTVSAVIPPRPQNITVRP